jgi:molybdopterin biosynthesis enzyme
VTAEGITAAWNVPISDKSSHDGIAISRKRAEERLTFEDGYLQLGEYIRLSMGSSVPEEFDTVLPSELCEFIKSRRVLFLGSACREMSCSGALS